MRDGDAWTRWSTSNAGYQLVFGVPALVANLSRAFTLEPGDVIATGTPRASASRASPCG